MSLLILLQVATVSERSRIMELEREVADLQLRLRASQQKEDAVSLSQQQISSLKAQAQAQEKKVCGAGGADQLGRGCRNMIHCVCEGDCSSLCAFYGSM